MVPTLQAYDGATGRALGAAGPSPFTDYPKLSPGRRWLVGRTAGGYEWYDAATLAKVGALAVPKRWFVAPPLPDGRAAYQPVAALTIDLDGTRAILASSHGDDCTMRVALLDLAAGAVTECKACRGFADHGPSTVPAATWCDGDAGLIQFRSGHVLPWAAGQCAMSYREDGRYTFPAAGYAPDRRYWSVLGKATPEFAAKAGSTRTPPPTSFLTAATLPFAQDLKYLGAAASGWPWPLGTPLRIESNGDGDSAHHEEVVEIVASGFAARGYPIDPSAKAGVRVTTGRVTSGPTSKDLTPQETGYIVATPGSHFVAYKMVPGLLIDSKARAIDESGRLGRDLTTSLHGGVNGDDRDMVLRTFRSSVYTFASPNPHFQVDYQGHDDLPKEQTRLTLGVDDLAEPGPRPPR